jgi:hypothetical protein
MKDDILKLHNNSQEVLNMGEKFFHLSYGMWEKLLSIGMEYSIVDTPIFEIEGLKYCVDDSRYSDINYIEELDNYLRNKNNYKLYIFSGHIQSTFTPIGNDWIPTNLVWLRFKLIKNSTETLNN